MKYSNELYIKSIGTASITSRLISADVIEEGEPVYKAAICVNTTDLMLKVCSLLEELHFRKSRCFLEAYYLFKIINIWFYKN